MHITVYYIVCTQERCKGRVGGRKGSGLASAWRPASGTPRACGLPDAYCVPGWYRELAYVVTFLDGLLFQGLASKVLHTYYGREENSLSVRVAG